MHVIELWVWAIGHVRYVHLQYTTVYYSTVQCQLWSTTAMPCTGIVGGMFWWMLCYAMLWNGMLWYVMICSGMLWHGLSVCGILLQRISRWRIPAFSGRVRLGRDIFFSSFSLSVSPSSSCIGKVNEVLRVYGDGVCDVLPTWEI